MPHECYNKTVHGEGTLSNRYSVVEYNGVDLGMYNNEVFVYYRRVVNP